MSPTSLSSPPNPARLAARVAMAAVVGYGLGTVSSADLVARQIGDSVDLRSAGTGNPGSMNAAQQLGKGAGAAVAAGDVGKAAVAGWVGRWLAGAAGANAAASAAVIGHCFPPGRKGGKGVAASIGQVVATFPVYLPIDIAVGAAATMLPGARHRTRMATMVASSVWVASAALWWRRRWPNPGAEPASISLGVGALVSSAAIAVRFYAEADQVEAAVSEQRSEEG